MKLTAIILILTALLPTDAVAESIGRSMDISFSNLEKCADSSYTMSQYEPGDALDPCILYDIRHNTVGDSNGDLHNSLDNAPIILETTEVTGDNTGNNDTRSNNPSEVTLVQVTPSLCNNHRDGAATAVRLMNAKDNDKGIAIGYNHDHFVKFRLISIVAGNHKNMTDYDYNEIHKVLLDSVLETVDNAQFIIGSCSFASAADKPVALKRKKMVVSQVGPPGFYKDVDTNPYVFGIHVNSDTYPLPALRALQFHLNFLGISTSLQSVRVMYRDKSEFFYSTCQSVVDEATKEGFNVTAIKYDPEGMEDGSDVKNSQNIPFLESLADRLCPSRASILADVVDIDDNDHQLPPAIFACVQNQEADAILAKMRSNGCRPSMAWFTTATWGWANDNLQVVPYFQGAGQWHRNFEYSDTFFRTGQDVIEYGLEEFGYSGSYDHVVSYTIPTLFGNLLESFFRIDDFPDVMGAFSNQYEVLRRAMVNIKTATIFGPVSFNKYQRNIGRGPAGMQWIQTSVKDETMDFVLACMSPDDQADAAIIVPSPSGRKCSAGTYVNRTSIEMEPALLRDKCSACAINLYMAVENEAMECVTCPLGSNTANATGAIECVKQDANLNLNGMKLMGYLFVAISWSFSIGYVVWMIAHKNDSVVKISQPEFLFFICVGAMMSTSAIIPLTLAEADVGEDTTAASRNCQAVPFLYSLGWVLMYSSLTAKSYRLNKLATAASRLQRKKITAKEMYRIIIGLMVLDAIILIAWQVTDPLVYVRSFKTNSKDDDTYVVTIESIGHCKSNSLWKFLGPLIAIHVCLMVVTNGLLWRVRKLSDRYQEQKYVALASIYICELLLLGVPVLIAVQDSAAARYIVIAGVIFLTDTGVLSFIFIPKIKFQSEGLPEGMSVVESMQPRRSSVGFRQTETFSRQVYNSDFSRKSGSDGIDDSVKIQCSGDFTRDTNNSKFDSVNSSVDNKESQKQQAQNMNMNSDLDVEQANDL